MRSKEPKPPVNKLHLAKLKSLMRQTGSDEKLLAFLKALWYHGFCDGANAEVAENDERWLKIKKGVDYVFYCPECGCEMTLDMLDLISQSGDEDLDKVAEKAEREKYERIQNAR